jgi:hypothetical protein
VFIDTISDPWAGVAIALPLILSSAFVSTLNWRSRQGWSAGTLCGASILAFVAARTRLFGILDFLPPSSFIITTPDGLVTNVGWMFRILANLFNIVPRVNINLSLVIVIDFFALATILVSAAALAVRHIRKETAAYQLLVGVTILSIVGVSLAFLLNLWSPADYPVAGRFFQIFIFLAPFSLVWRRHATLKPCMLR